VLRETFDLSAEQFAALEAHWNLLLRWNRTLNLTTIDDWQEAEVRHYGESLFLGRHLPAGNLRIADVGSGAGFPGVPVAILRPECEVTLIESHQRKAVFLREASRGMANVRVVAQRAETMSGRFDWVVSRAVSYADLRGILGKLAPNAALLSGAEEPPGAGWRSIQLPWGENRFLRICST
jgi:16S rRNA (guanine527-N7)-methyltransferase